jgi:hypothetical protein
MLLLEHQLAITFQVVILHRVPETHAPFFAYFLIE